MGTAVGEFGVDSQFEACGMKKVKKADPVTGAVTGVFDKVKTTFEGMTKGNAVDNLFAPIGGAITAIGVGVLVGWFTTKQAKKVPYLGDVIPENRAY